jgi:hypothetical protein
MEVLVAVLAPKVLLEETAIHPQPLLVRATMEVRVM